MKTRWYKVTWTTHQGKQGYKMSAKVEDRSAKGACEYIRLLWKAGELTYRPYNLKATWIDRAE